MPRSDVMHYEGLTYWSPLAPAKVEVVLDLVHVETESTALDLGCGRAEWLLRLAELYGAHGTGVDASEDALAAAREAAAARGVAARVDFVRGDATTFAASPASYDVVSWLGGPYLGATFETTLETLVGWTRPGGQILVGHGFWEQSPDPDYLAATGIDAAEFGSHADTIALARKLGLRLLYTTVSNRDEWDEFEGRILAN